MDWAKSIIDALYGKFLLRDFFGKIVPGAIVIFFLGALVNIAQVPDTLPIAYWLFGLGAAWSLGVAVQICGQSVGLALDHPPDYSEIEDRYSMSTLFNSVAPDVEKHIVERLVVIKEATGNNGSAIVLVFLLSIVLYLSKAVLVKWGVSISLASFLDVSLAEGITFLCIAVMLSIMLLWTNRVHALRQFKYMESVNRRFSPPQVPSSNMPVNPIR